MLRDLFSLFPAYAGVILEPAAIELPFMTFPRIRGGDPHVVNPDKRLIFFSPHTRG